MKLHSLPKKIATLSLFSPLFRPTFIERNLIAHVMESSIKADGDDDGNDGCNHDDSISIMMMTNKYYNMTLR